MSTARQSGFLLSQLKLLVSVASWPLRHGRRGIRKLGEFITIWRSGEFDPHWYLEQNGSVKKAGAHPLQHFVMIGDEALKNPNPSFSTQQYKRERFVQWRDHNAFAHYLRNRDKASFLLPAGVARYPKLKIVVVAWDLGHNPAGRALLLAQLLSRRHDVELWGAHFPRYGSALWEPIRSLRNVTVRSWNGCDLPDYSDVLMSQLDALSCDVIYISKARMPSMALGLLAKKLRNVPMIVDIDDYEPAFFPSAERHTIADAIEATKSESTLCPHDEEWTLASENLIGAAEHVTVSNIALQQKFGGCIVPHLRDETIFVPSETERRKQRQKLAYAANDFVILFVGTPRMHKGLRAVIDALNSLDRSDIHLLVIGTPADAEARTFFETNTSKNIRRLNNISFKALPGYLNVGDLVCLMQNPDSVVSQYQLPAKLIDALAMGIPLLVSDTPPMRPYIESGMATLTSEAQLPKAIAHVCDNYRAYKQRAAKNRDWFLREASFHAFEAKFEKILDSTLQNRRGLNPAAEELLDYLLDNAKRAVSAVADEQGQQRYNFVYFWKQNDSGIYGRRQDMLVKYLLKDKRVSRIVHFDLPMTESYFSSLKTRAKTQGEDQSALVFENTAARRNGRIREDGRLSEYTFVHDQAEDNIYRYIYDYAQYVETALENSKAFEPGVKTVFLICPRVPEFPYLLQRFRPHFIVSDVIDNHLKWKQKRWPRADLEEHYRSVLGISDLVVTNNPENQADMAQWASGIALIPNAGEAFTEQEISRFAKPKELCALGDAPIIGYSGNLDSQRIDIDLLDELVQRQAEAQFVFIGSTHQSREALTLDKHDNVHFLGAKPYDEALHYIAHFDAAIVPHKDTELTRIMDPLKLYVYLSVGVPIISTPIAVNQSLAGRIKFAASAEDFCLHVEHCLSKKENKPSNQSHLTHEECWPQRVDALLNMIDKHLMSMPSEEALES